VIANALTSAPHLSVTSGRASTVGLCHAVEDDDRALAGAREAIRGLIDEVSLEADGDRLRIILMGNLAGCCDWPKKTKGRRRPTTSWTKYSWLRGRATSGTCSCGAERRDTIQALGRASDPAETL
jgi:hypothetical protein